MTILKYDYLYSQILKYILFYLYNYTFTNIPSISINYQEGFQNFYVETVQYARVSKRWFEICSNILTNEILKFKNFDILKRFMPFKEKEIGFTFYNSPFKLIKLENSVMIYNKLEEYNNDEEKGITKNFRKIIISVLESKYYTFAQAIKESINILLSEKQYPENVQFNLDLSIAGGYGMPEDSIEEFEGGNQLYGYDFDRLIKNKKTISLLCITGNNSTNSYEELKVFEKISKLNPKYLLSFSDITKNMSPVFQIPNLKRIDVCNSSLEPNVIKLNNEITSIRYFQLKMAFIDIIRAINGNHDLEPLFSTNVEDLQKDWSNLIKLLTQNRTIKFLRLEDDADSDNIQRKFIINPSCITEGFKSLLSNPKCIIGTLEFKYIYFIDQLFLQGLKLNQSIHTLIFINTKSKPVIQILPHNKNIKHLSFLNGSTINDLFELFDLLKQQAEIHLYSISFIIEDFDQDFTKILNEININSFQIKEYNFYVKKDQFNLNSQILLNNNSIINFKIKNK